MKLRSFFINAMPEYDAGEFLEFMAFHGVRSFDTVVRDDLGKVQINCIFSEIPNPRRTSRINFRVGNWKMTRRKASDDDDFTTQSFPLPSETKHLRIFQ